MEMTFEKANASQKETLNKLFGNLLTDDDVALLRQIVTETGALAEVETMISNLLHKSQQALAMAKITSQAKEALSELALAATSRRV